jgi:hypothetical protein
LSNTDDELSVGLTHHQLLAMETNSEQEAAATTTRTTTRDLFAPVSSVEALCDQYVQGRVWDEEFDKFNPDTFEKDSLSHIKNYEIDKLGAVTGRLGSEERQVIVKNVALFNEVHFIRDPFTLKTISVSTADMQQDMVRRGFDAIMVDHVTDPMALPMAPDAPTGSASRKEDLPDETPPTHLKLPPDGTNNFVPKLFVPDGDTYACAVVKAYEEKAVDMQQSTVYSPIRLWTTAELSNRRLRGDSKLTVRRKAYWVIRKMGINPEENLLTQAKILANAKTYLLSERIQSANWETLALVEYSNR